MQLRPLIRPLPLVYVYLAEAVNRLMLLRQLRRRMPELRVETAEDGEELIQLYQRRASEVALVLTDFQMPRKTGGQAAAALRLLGYVGQIVGITGNALSEDVACFKRMGADRVLSKPVEVPVLLQIIAAALSPAARAASP